jgi:bla regulator protein blaR1
MINLIRNIGPALANHLWQSTLFAAAAWLLTLLLRKDRARIRFAIWLTASMKFLVPFSLLIALGSLLPSPQHVAAPTAVYFAIDSVGLPFSDSPAPPRMHISASQLRLPANLPLILASLWLCGAAIVLLIWAAHWRHVSRALRCSVTIDSGREIEILRCLEHRTNTLTSISIRQSQQMMEPGIVGVYRPTLIWPAQLSEQLDDGHIEAILAHEIMHARRRDNLTAALHMLVEAAFWFHPIVWWMERRMIDERERACDEAVVQLGGKPEVYAESLLKACRFCVESPLTCVAGITGADLSRRVRSIMTLRLKKMSPIGKLALAASSFLVVATPVAFGMVRIVPLFAQILHPNGPLPSFEVATIKPSQGLKMTMGAPPPGEKVISQMVFSVGSSAKTPAPPSDRVSLVATPGLLISMAYNIPALSKGRILGGPDWLNVDYYDIQAKIPEAEFAAMQKMRPAQSRERRQLMEQSLLADRFKLKVHFETREMPVYALVLAKGGSKLTPAKDGESENISISGDAQTSEMKATAAKPANLARLLQMQPDAGDRMLVDQTGLTGTYDFTLKWSREQPGGSDSGASNTDAPSFFTALQEQLGLRLVPTKAPVEVIVIDHIEQPSPN